MEEKKRKKTGKTTKKKDMRTARKVNKDVSKQEKEINLNAKKSKKGWKIFKVCLFIFIALCIVGAGIVVGVKK